MPVRTRGHELPTTRNTLANGVDAHSVIPKCRPQNVAFKEGAIRMVRLKVPLPSGRQMYIMRFEDEPARISATNMFKASFPEHTTAQLESEMEWIEEEYATHDANGAPGTWVGAEDARELGTEYGILPWIEGLLGAPYSRGASLTPAPELAAPSETTNVDDEPTPRPTRKDPTRAANHPKRSVRSSRRARESSTAPTEPETESEVGTEAAHVVLGEPITTSDQGVIVQGVHHDDGFIDGNNVVRTHEAAAESSTGQSFETRQVIVENEIDGGRDIEAEIEESKRIARETMEAMRSNADDEVDTLEESEGLRRRHKRDVEALYADEDEEMPLVKKTKVERLEIEVVKERRKVRALLGLVVGLGASAVLPYIL
ncbi:hypothetical protein SAICODRAFT_30899 [Saitoella complicata NRRL Y-17804]|nr:uncharacterized protein SAICODRAFT_30899 [Saitoella complicata NRRL Y-17804]ODQ52124.1 hypothetical protein SAICODRAFT_30899 [Saitoella complicata NRRL Y-17804]